VTNRLIAALIAVWLALGVSASAQINFERTNTFVTTGAQAGLTASTVQAQGEGLILTQVVEYSTVANTLDTVTLPGAVAGRHVEIFNNGANTLQIFPFVGDDLGRGVNVASILNAGESVEYTAFDITTWTVDSTRAVLVAEMVDEDNTDPFVVSAANSHQVYHTNGMAAGSLNGWTFDIGGGGTSFSVASIADSPGSSGTQAQITTSLSHTLVAGAIVSISNASAGTNAGLHIVLAPVTATTFEIASANSTTATATLNEAATLTALPGTGGVYSLAWAMSATSATSNETFDFQVYVNTTATGPPTRRKFGTNGDFGAIPGNGVATITAGDKVSFGITNDDTAADITIRNLSLVLVRL